MGLLGQFVIFLAASVIFVPLFKKFQLGAVLGYLVAGILIGPWGMQWIGDVDTVMYFSEFGVVLLLFMIGLELQPARLWVLRKQVFGLGLAQVFLTSLLLSLILYFYHLPLKAAIVGGLGFAMSSTAFVLQALSERGQMTTRHGRESFTILLFQDLAVIPILAILPILGAKGAGASTNLLGIFRAIGIIILVIGAGRFLFRPFSKIVAQYGGREVFTALALFIVIGIAALMQQVGLSMALGAFLAGVVLADSEYRHELEADIEPFKGLLLGLFFMAVGMSTNISLILQNPLKIFSYVVLLMGIKFLVLFGISRFSKSSNYSARQLGISLCQGGEFAFVLFGVAENFNIFSAHMSQVFVVVVTVSMIVSPFLFLIDDKIFTSIFDRKPAPQYDSFEEVENTVVIAGFGRVGQIIARVLATRKISFTTLDKSSEQVDFVRRFGNRVHYGDASRLDLLHAAKADKAKIFIVAIQDIETSLKVVEIVQKNFPHLKIYARARNRVHAYQLMERKVEILQRDTYLSSLWLAKEVLKGLEFSEADAEKTVARFQEVDERSMLASQAFYKDEKKLVAATQKTRAELESLFEADKAGREV